MSIEMDNPQTPLEKVDAAANWVQQMFLSHMIKDESKFKEAHQKATSLLADVTDYLDNQENP